LGAGVCGHAAVVAYNETMPAKISPAVMRMLFTSDDVARVGARCFIILA
jgi:hypothetical protein